jgi:hypothetical protein
VAKHELTISDKNFVTEFQASKTDNGYLYMIQGYRDICLSPKDARILARWISEQFKPRKRKRTSDRGGVK